MTVSDKPYEQLLAELLAQAGLTAAQVETRSGGRVTARTVRNHLSGRHVPREEKVQQIADVLQRKDPTLTARRQELLAAAARAATSALSQDDDGRHPPRALAPDGTPEPPPGPGPTTDASGTADPPADRDPAAARRRRAPGGPRRRRRGGTLAAGALLVLLVAAGLLGLARRGAGPDSRSPAGAAITAPGDGQTVDSPITVTGTAPAATDAGAWLLVRPPDGQFYLTGAKQALRPDGTGAWSTPVRLGRSQRDGGAAFDLLLVTAPVPGTFSDDARAKSAPGQGGWGTLPPDARVLARARVVLGQYHGRAQE